MNRSAAPQAPLLFPEEGVPDPASKGGLGKRSGTASRQAPGRARLVVGSPVTGAATMVVCGVDEAGRGPLAGPVFAAAVILPPRRRIRGLRDSKKLTPEERDRLAIEIRAKALAWAVAEASVEEIDRLNILQATMLAMERAVALLPMAPCLARVDGNRAPSLRCPVETLIGGDDLDASISAASILAKTSRDRVMEGFEARYPDYGFGRHKGYSTPDHLAALDRLGPCDIHRRSFAPVRIALLRGQSLFPELSLPDHVFDPASLGDATVPAALGEAPPAPDPDAPAWPSPA
jgi:ribonuclease HII